MSVTSYLQTLTLRLADGIGRLPEEQRELHAAYFLGQQRDNGGFAGREGASDPYYTGFGLRALALTGQLGSTVSQAAANFLAERLQGRESIVDFYSLLYSAEILKVFADLDLFANAPKRWVDAVYELLCDLRRDDGGFAKAAAGKASSTYHTFLVLLCFQLIQRNVPEPERVVAFFRSQFVDDGGYREIRVSKRAGTNPTAAAIAGLRMLDAVDEEQAEMTTDFLLDMQTDEGGFRANTRIPIADLLSSFTALVTLCDLGAVREVDLGSLQRYVDSLAHEDGGFVGAAWDTGVDVEYSFYGLGCLGLLKGTE